MKTDDQKALFELVDSIGEILEGSLHIIETTEYPRCADEAKYRIYHKDGYCVDVMKEVETEDDDGKVTYYYHYYAEWDGFKPVPTADLLIKLLKQSQKDAKHS